MQQIVRTITLAYNTLSRPHRIILGSLTLITLAVIAWRPASYHSENDPVVRSVALNLTQSRSLLPEASEPLDQALPDDDIPQDELDSKYPDETGAHEYVISTGDTLGSILTQYGIDMADISLLASQHRDLRNLKIGQQISWFVNEKGDLQQVIWEVSRRETRTYDRVGNSFKEKKTLQQGEWHDSVLSGRLTGSFFNSAKNAGLNTAEIHAVTKALQWQLDLNKLHSGDQFSVLISREKFDGRNEQSRLLGVRMRSEGKDYYAIRADDGKFYDHRGSGLERGFMRFPTMKQFRISSGFNPRRLNPVTGRIAPHKGVDFAMPVGTPVLAVGDGDVLIAKRSGAAGNYVVIRHGRQYTTRYMHLKKLLVEPGQKVKRGDRIALSGNTGRSTGPHLHYELWMNQQAVNPITVKLPRSEGLTGQDRREYMAMVKQVASQLATF
ncbi:murein DD-endopeptidase MepM [Candidatus Fukatsuia symbiotica]|uniref:Murein DD-endopeptidase MepM n=1 Tax=Candidatus Fukatsuia symbiotica TaxID=1878942 RepID=A0A2U8I744_9GAMM|nr:murein DD-endopeptidase MepM [Candidatus Fukatsuia symbiotica]AWK14899.1 murein DD-endopeptidase MepM [Candidatus Fukatsuia symbiotica]MEA9445247.1 murein DD-endopeptidase MepM [Candidatus Fukatsuia symbiotica]